MQEENLNCAFDLQIFVALNDVKITPEKMQVIITFIYFLNINSYLSTIL